MEEEPLYTLKETGTAIAKKTVCFSEKEAEMIRPFLSKIRTLSKSKLKITHHKNHSCIVRLKGPQMDVELANHYLKVAINKLPKEDYAMLTGNNNKDADAYKKLLSNDDLVKKEKTQNVEEKLQELLAQEKQLKERMRKRSIAKQILEALHSSGPLETKFWSMCQIPYQRVLPKKREKAIAAITAFVTEPLLKKTSRKLLIFKKILDFFQSFHKSIESVQQSKYFQNYFQLLSKLVFRHKSKESSAVFQQLKQGLYQLKNSEQPFLSSKTYTKLSGLYHQIANPNENDLPKMLEIAQFSSRHLQKRLDIYIKGRKSSKSQPLK